MPSSGLAPGHEQGEAALGFLHLGEAGFSLHAWCSGFCGHHSTADTMAHLEASVTVKRKGERRGGGKGAVAPPRRLQTDPFPALRQKRGSHLQPWLWDRLTRSQHMSGKRETGFGELSLQPSTLIRKLQLSFSKTAASCSRIPGWTAVSNGRHTVSRTHLLPKRTAPRHPQG